MQCAAMMLPTLSRKIRKPPRVSRNFGTRRPPMPMASASDPSPALGRFGTGVGSVPLEYRRALLDEGAGGCLVVLGLAGADHARRFRIERLGERALLGDLHVLLHVP